MSNNESLKGQKELEQKIQEKIRQEKENKICREEELRRIKERQHNERKQNYDIVRGKPTGSRPGKDD